MNEETLRYVRSDTTRRSQAGKRMREDTLGAKVVHLNGIPQADVVQVMLLGVACDRGVGLGGGRIGAADGPTRFRDAFYRLIAPDDWRHGTLLDAGDLLSAGRTDETHARLSEVVAVLHGRFPAARLLVVGGGHDALYGEALGRVRHARRGADRVRAGLMLIDSVPDAAAYEGEAHHHTALWRLLREPAAALGGDDVIVWGAHPSLAPPAQVAFLRSQGAQLLRCDAGAEEVWRALHGLHERAAPVLCSIDLTAFGQALAPGVGEPAALGLDPAAVATLLARHGRAGAVGSLGIWGLNPRFDRDGATARLAARLAWSWCAGAT